MLNQVQHDIKICKDETSKACHPELDSGSAIFESNGHLSHIKRGKMRVNGKEKDPISRYYPDITDSINKYYILKPEE